MRDEIIEVMARVLFEQDWSGKGSELEWVASQGYWIRYAQAALQALLDGGYVVVRKELDDPMFEQISETFGYQGLSVAGVQAAPDGATDDPISAGKKPPSDHLLICIPSVESGIEVTVEAFPGDPGAAQDAFLATQAKGYYAEILTVYRHHGKGALDNKWWGGMWTGYGKRHEAWKTNQPPTDQGGKG